MYVIKRTDKRGGYLTLKRTYTPDLIHARIFVDLTHAMPYLGEGEVIVPVRDILIPANFKVTA